jgi:hypothetical protein
MRRRVGLCVSDSTSGRAGGVGSIQHLVSGGNSFLTRPCVLGTGSSILQVRQEAAKVIGKGPAEGNEEAVEDAFAAEINTRVVGVCVLGDVQGDVCAAFIEGRNTIDGFEMTT